MQIPFDALIAPDKLTGYLLLDRPWDDESRFLAQAGFTLDNPLALDSAIRRLTAQRNATEDGTNE